MFSTVLSEIKGLVDKRFLLTSFFPLLVFVAAGSLLVAAANGGVDTRVKDFGEASGAVQLLIIGGALAATFALAAFVSSMSTLVFRLYEGYLAPGWLRNLGIALQRQRQQHTQADTATKFPEKAMQGTSFGNVVRAAEEYPEHAYGLSFVAVWPRLFLAMPEAMRQSIAGSADTIQFLLTTSLLATLFAIGAGIYVVIESLGATTYLVSVFGALVLAVLAYLGAVESAVEYGLHLRAAFDLYRNDVLTQLYRSLPSTTDEERRTWADVSEFLKRGEPRPVHYIARAK